MITTYKAAPDIDVLTSNFPIPGFGLVPINAFVLHGAEPCSSTPARGRERRVHGGAAVGDRSGRPRWIWLTHTDFDHIGVAAPAAGREPAAHGSSPRSSGSGSWACRRRCRWTGCTCSTRARRITVGDRTLTAVKPPVFDNPITTGFYDDRSGALFSCGLLRRPAGGGARARRGPLRRGAAPGPGLLGHGRLPVVAQGRPRPSSPRSWTRCGPSTRRWS